MEMQLSDIKKLLHECCDVDSFNISLCSDEEQGILKDLLPNARSIIVLGHHIESSIEWMWFPSKSERRNNTCAADLHLKGIAEEICRYINSKGLKSVVLPYPGSSGILFKRLACNTRMGELGDNYLFLHHRWGPWIHLRAIVSEIEIESKQNIDKTNICLHCNKCINSCPGGAIEKHIFNGLKCNETQIKLEQTLLVPKGFIWKCEICARVCPIGKEPEEIINID